MRNCARCRKPFVYTGSRLCRDCRQEKEQDFEKVKAYLEETPGADVEEIHEETGVDRDMILYFMRQGRLEVMDESKLKIQCQVCGKAIPDGRICRGCLQKLRQPMQEKQKGKGQESKRPRHSQRETSHLYIQERLEKKRGRE